MSIFKKLYYYLNVTQPLDTCQYASMSVWECERNRVCAHYTACKKRSPNRSDVWGTRAMSRAHVSARLRHRLTNRRPATHTRCSLARKSSRPLQIRLLRFRLLTYFWPITIIHSFYCSSFVSLNNFTILLDYLIFANVTFIILPLILLVLSVDWILLILP